MGFSVYVFAVASPLIFGADLSPIVTPPAQPAAERADVVPVNVIDRFFQGNKANRKKSSSVRRKRPAVKSQSEAPLADIPGRIPIPLPKPIDGGGGADLPPVSTAPADAGTGSDGPLPKPKTSEPKKGEAQVDGAPQTPKVPDVKQDKDQSEKGPNPEVLPPEADDQPEPVHEDPAELKACLSELDALGAKFTRITPIDEGKGCGIEQPIKLDEILPGLSLGGAVMRCKTAAGLAHWLRNTVQPALDVAKPGRKVVSVITGTTYACRLRNSASSGMISEHARGNGFDVAAFTLDNGETLDMKPRRDDHTMEGALQAAVTAGACLYFTTVLAPGSDATHETHMHLDVKDRKGGYRICEFQ